MGKNKAFGYLEESGHRVSKLSLYHATKKNIEREPAKIDYMKPYIFLIGRA
jgi:hypothetical protein